MWLVVFFYLRNVLFMLGNLYKVPDKKWWGFEAPGRSDHPGALVSMASTHKVNLLKGTDVRSRDYSLAQVVVEPDDSNQLLKATSFGVKPHPKSLRKVQRELSDRLIGTLSEADLDRMQKALERYFIDEGR